MAISVIIPTYNSSQYLAETLESVSSQQRLPDEVLVVDDGSKDATLAIVKDWAAKQRFAVNILYNKIPNEGFPGPAGGRQTGLQAACGDMIALLDHDDLMLPSHLRLMEQALLDNPSVSLCFADATEFWENDAMEESFFAGKAIEDAKYTELGESGLRLIQEPLINTLLTGSYIPTAANLFRRDAALSAGGFRPIAGSCDDMLFFLCLSRLGDSAYYPFPLARKRNHRDNLSHERHNLQNCWAYLGALCTLREESSTKWNLATTDLARLDLLLGQLHDDILYHASRQGFSTFLKNRSKLKSKIDKNVIIGVVRATLRSSRIA